MTFIDNEDKRKAMEICLGAISKEFGKGSVMVGGEGVPEVEFIPTGIPSLDKVLGGGWGRGRICELYGAESTGKTTLSLSSVGEVQKQGGRAAYIDMEHALDLVYADTLGVDVDSLLISQPSSAEDALNITQRLIMSKAVDMIVIDSVAALVPRAEIEGNIGDSLPGLQARLMSQALRIIAGPAEANGCTVIFINQTRMKIGVMYGNPETTSGGNALKFYASQRVKLSKGKIIGGENPYGAMVGVKVVKNKIAPPAREAELTMIFGEGIDIISDICEQSVGAGLLEMGTGKHYSLKGKHIAHGDLQMREYFQTNPDVLLDLKSKLANLKQEPTIVGRQEGSKSNELQGV